MAILKDMSARPRLADDPKKYLYKSRYNIYTVYINVILCLNIIIIYVCIHIYIYEIASAALSSKLLIYGAL